MTLWKTPNGAVFDDEHSDRSPGPGDVPYVAGPAGIPTASPGGWPATPARSPYSAPNLTSDLGAGARAGTAHPSSTIVGASNPNVPVGHNTRNPLEVPSGVPVKSLAYTAPGTPGPNRISGDANRPWATAAEKALKQAVTQIKGWNW